MGNLWSVKKALGFMIIPLGLVVAACGSSNSSPTQPAGSTSTPSSGGSVALSARNVSGLGTVLVNSQGRTLYVFAPDKAKKVTCVGSCATVWPPLKIASGQKPSLSGAVKASLVSSASDPSGGSVVTYNGWPLYTYQADAQAGTDHGQALFSSGGLWYAITPAGTVIKKHVKQTTGPTGY
jgi:predicted lipoprotein with Yx(FWY)xxD motif